MFCLCWSACRNPCESLDGDTVVNHDSDQTLVLLLSFQEISESWFNHCKTWSVPWFFFFPQLKFRGIPSQWCFPTGISTKHQTQRPIARKTTSGDSQRDPLVEGGLNFWKRFWDLGCHCVVFFCFFYKRQWRIRYYSIALLPAGRKFCC